MFIDICNDCLTCCRRPRQEQSALIGIGDDKSKLLKVYQKLRMVPVNLPSQKVAERRPCCVVSPQLVYKTVNTRYKRVTKMGRILTKHRRGFPTWSCTDFVKCCLSGNKSRLVGERTSFCECLGVLGWVKVRTGDWQPKPREKPYRGKSSMTRNLRSSCLLPLDDPEDAQCRPSGLHHLCCVTNLVAESENSMCCEVVII